MCSGYSSEQWQSSENSCVLLSCSCAICHLQDKTLQFHLCVPKAAAAPAVYSRVCQVGFCRMVSHGFLGRGVVWKNGVWRGSADWINLMGRFRKWDLWFFNRAHGGARTCWEKPDPTLPFLPSGAAGSWSGPYPFLFPSIASHFLPNKSLALDSGTEGDPGLLVPLRLLKLIVLRTFDSCNGDPWPRETHLNYQRYFTQTQLTSAPKRRSKQAQ